MTKKKKTVIFTGITSVVFLALSWSFSVIISFKCSWISSDFLFALFGGAFASSLVVLISEVFGYRQLKKSMECELYAHTIYLYTAATVANNTMTMVIENTEIPVAPEMLNQQTFQISSALNCIFNLDYSTFCKKQELLIELTAFKEKHSTHMAMIQDCVYLPISIYQANIDVLKENPYFNGPINTTYQSVLKTAQILQRHFDAIMLDCEKLLDKIDYSGRFYWNKSKKEISEMNSINLEDGSLENFFKRNQ